MEDAVRPGIASCCVARGRAARLLLHGCCCTAAAARLLLLHVALLLHDRPRGVAGGEARREGVVYLSYLSYLIPSLEK